MVELGHADARARPIGTRPLAEVGSRRLLPSKHNGLDLAYSAEPGQLLAMSIYARLPDEQSAISHVMFRVAVTHDGDEKNLCGQPVFNRRHSLEATAG